MGKLQDAGTDGPLVTNRLVAGASPYLRSAAHQPVDWHPWSADVFARAQREDKPILLDIGAVWCHWCHVMDRESYEDPRLAAFINERFVPVKVDRDERPDVDVRYQKAVQAMTGQGGWPLTAFLLPDGRCFYGGTYYPPVDAHGRPSFRRVLEAIDDAFRTRRHELEANAAHLAEHIAARASSSTSPSPPPSPSTVVASSVQRILADHDAEHGGFGSAPKFPHPAALDLLLGADAGARDVARFTLERMRAGGVYDQLAGGYHRYSVDAAWRVPHFEKMLYDNAGLLRSHHRAGDRATARDIARFLRDVLEQPGGGFGGSQDADVGTVPQDGTDGRARSSSVEDDGDFFTWTLDELRDAVGDSDLSKLMAAHFGVRAKGDMHHDPARCVLHVAADAEALAAAFGSSIDDMRARLHEGERRMRNARAKRIAPFVDPTRYANWNGMAIAALLEVAEPESDAMALRALDAFLAHAFDPSRGFARALGSAAAGLLDDQAQMLDALVEAHFATGQERYLSAARATADVILHQFAHPDGAFADRRVGEAEAASLAAPERPTQDAPTASANGVAIRALLRLGAATGGLHYGVAAQAALDALLPETARAGLFGGALLLALRDAESPPPRIVVKGDVERYRATARRHARPGATLARATDAGVPEEARAFPREGAMVCVGTRCLAPARSTEDLAARLSSLTR